MSEIFLTTSKNTNQVCELINGCIHCNLFCSYTQPTSMVIMSQLVRYLTAMEGLSVTCRWSWVFVGILRCTLEYFTYKKATSSMLGGEPSRAHASLIEMVNTWISRLLDPSLCVKLDISRNFSDSTVIPS